MNTEILTLIGSYGFPIIACIGMAWYVKYREDKHSEELKETRDAHKSEMDEVTKAINNNTLALQHLTDFMQKRDDN